MSDKEKLRQQWATKAEKQLKGKKIAAVRYLTEQEKENMMWRNSAPVIFFEDGSYLFPSRDDEGNNAGALFTSFDELPTIPII